MKNDSLHSRSLRDHTSKISSMRYNIRLIVFSCLGLLVSVLGYIVNATIQYPEGEVNWYGIASFISSIAVLLTGVMYNQTVQKKHEINKDSKIIDDRDQR